MRHHNATHAHNMAAYKQNAASYHVYPIQDLIAHIAADSHMRSTGGCIQWHISRLILGFEVWVQLLPCEQ